jgi:hypothetical protein
LFSTYYSAVQIQQFLWAIGFGYLLRRIYSFNKAENNLNNAFL